MTPRLIALRTLCRALVALRKKDDGKRGEGKEELGRSRKRSFQAWCENLAMPATKEEKPLKDANPWSATELKHAQESPEG